MLCVKDVVGVEWSAAHFHACESDPRALSAGSAQNATLTAALLYRLTHHAHIAEISVESYRLREQRNAGMVRAQAKVAASD